MVPAEVPQPEVRSSLAERLEPLPEPERREAVLTWVRSEVAAVLELPDAAKILRTALCGSSASTRSAP